MTTEIKIYVACLASYNAGVLHGRWICVDSDVDAIQQEIAAMLRESKFPNVTVDCPHCDDCPEERKTCKTCAGFGVVDSAEEYAVHDYDDETGIFSNMGEYPDLEAIAEIFGAWESISVQHGEDAATIIVKVLKDRGVDPCDMPSESEDCFAGIWADAEDWVSEREESSGAEVPERLQNYIDWKAFARDEALNGHVSFICTASGEFLQDYDSMRGRECLVMYNR